MATSDMTGLKRFHDELETMFASSIETEMGFRLLVDWLRTLESDPRVDSSFGVQVGEGDPRHASTRFQYEKPLEELIRDSEEGGEEPSPPQERSYLPYICSLGRRISVSHSSRVWSGMQEPSGERCLPRLEQVPPSDSAPRCARLDRNPSTMCFFSKGDRVAFTEDQMHGLFARLIEELNRLGETYYGQNPGFTLDKPLW